MIQFAMVHDATSTALADEQVWGQIREVADTLLTRAHRPASAGPLRQGAYLREFEAGEEMFYARAMRLTADEVAPEGVLLVAIERRGRRFPSAGELQDRLALSPREAEVALLLAERCSNREIADELDITEHTARRHTEKVLLKLQVKSRTDVRGVLLAEAA